MNPEFGRVRRSFERLTASAQRNARRIRALPETSRVFVLAGLILAAIFVPLILIAYRAAILRAIFILAVTLAALALAVAIGLGAVHARRARRRHDAQQGKDAGETPATSARSAPSPRRAPLTDRDAILQAIARGALEPVAGPVALLLRPAEMLWHHAEAWRRDRDDQLIEGELYVTSLRVAFVCPELPAEISIGGLNAVQVVDQDLQLIGQSAATSFTLVLDDPELAAAYVARAVRDHHAQSGAAAEPHA